MKKVSIIVVVFLMFFVMIFTNSYAASRVSDAGFPKYLNVFKDELIFAAECIGDCTQRYGIELYVFNGESVSKIYDINPGYFNSEPRHFFVYNNELYFSAREENVGRELWKYDGTNVYLVADINPGKNDSNPVHFAIFNDELYFSANYCPDPIDCIGIELWKYDGNTASLVADIWPKDSSSNPVYLTVFKDHLYFNANNRNSGAELFKYDGNAVSQVADIWPGNNSSNPAFLTVFKDHLYFNANNGNSGAELFKYDGNAVSQVADIWPGSVGSFPSPAADNSDLNRFTIFENAIYFSAYDGIHGREPFKYDGHTAVLVADICPRTVFPHFVKEDSNAGFFTVFNKELYFSAYNSSSINAQLYRYNGRNVIPVPMKFSPQTQTYNDPRYLTVYREELYFTAGQGTSSSTYLYKIRRSPAMVIPALHILLRSD